MSGYASNASIESVAARIRGASRILVTSHAKPDGDALGSAAAIARAAAAVGVPSEIWIGGPIDPALAEAIAPDRVHEWPRSGERVEPRSGEPVEPRSGERVEPRSGERVEPRSGEPVEPSRGEPVEPSRGEPVEPSRGEPVEPSRGEHFEPAGEFDTIVVVDTGAFPQLEPLASWLRPRRDAVVGIDHHARGDEQVAATRIVDASCASTTELIVRVVDALGVPLRSGARGGDARGSIAEAIFIGLATDTGWFRFPAAGPAQFALASRLLAEGVDKDRLYRQLEQNHRPARLALLSRALASLERVEFGGDPSRGVAVMRLRLEDFEETAGGPLDTSGLVNEPLAIAGVAAAVLLSESEPGVVRASFRSSSAEGGGPAVDVNELAARFGGGGHRAAAGARFAAPLAEAYRRVLAAIAAGDGAAGA